VIVGDLAMPNSDEELRQMEVTTTHALEHYKNHCEFLGYSVEEDTEFSILCRHPRKDSLRLVLLNYGVGVLAQTFARLPERTASDPAALHAYANELNHMLLFMKACICNIEERDPFVMLTSVLEGAYDRKNLAIFLDNINQEMDQFYSYPKTRDMWQAQKG
jgi:hypothetical protein